MKVKGSLVRMALKEKSQTSPTVSPYVFLLASQFHRVYAHIHIQHRLHKHQNVYAHYFFVLLLYPKCNTPIQSTKAPSLQARHAPILSIAALTTTSQLQLLPNQAIPNWQYARRHKQPSTITFLKKTILLIWTRL